MPYEAVRALIDWLLDPKGPAPSKAPAAPKAAAAPAAAAAPQTFGAAELGSSPSRGPAGASVTLIEFIDFNCGFCKRAFETVENLLAHYPKDLRLVSKLFPLGDAGRPPAAAALCAHEQGKYWEYRKWLFTDASGPKDAAALKAGAAALGLDAAKFGACLDSGRTKAAVDADEKLGRAKGVQGTPTYFLNGEPLQGAQPLEVLVEKVGKKKR
jgi:protein-disulfide isomerase